MWTTDDIGDLSGRTALVTGANSGIGFETARLLHRHGATVVLGCRDPERAAAAAAALDGDPAGPPVRTLPLDLASLRSVRAAAGRLRDETGALDLLVCNAGVMLAPPGRTEDGFERHLGVNHLGHFALTGLLLDLLVAAPRARVVTVSSVAYRLGHLDPSALHRDHGPSPAAGFAAYARSKLANLLFAQGLHHRLSAAGVGTTVTAAHPGGSGTAIVRHSPRLVGRLQQPGGPPWRRWIAHEPAAAALSVVRAATDGRLRGGAFVGPDGPLGLTGSPAVTPVAARVHDRAAQDRLWAASEAATGVRYRLTALV